MPPLRQWLKRPETYLSLLAICLLAATADALAPPERQWLGRGYGVVIELYQHVVSPRLAGKVRCRYHPSCSEYSKQAVERYGLVAGLRLTKARLKRCTLAVPLGTEDRVPGDTVSRTSRPPLHLAGPTKGTAEKAMKKPRRRALVVGINHYTAGLSEKERQGARWRDLSGAVRDAEAMRDLLLNRYEFSAAGVVTLLDGAASREALLQNLEQHLLAGAEKGDELVFFYAGHGSQVPNPASEEEDKLDETLVPADSNRGAPDVRDKELGRLFNRMLDRGARLTVIFDSCHSGSAARGVPAGAVARYLPPSTRGVVDAAPVGGKPEERGALILSAAQDFELAFETVDELQESRGAFSHALLTALGRAFSGEPAEATFLRARALLQTEAARQQPVLAGETARRNEPLFGPPSGLAGKSASIAVLREDSDGTVLLQGGWAHGLAEGVELEVEVRPGDEVPATLRVTRLLGPSSAEAIRVGEVRSRRTRRVAAGDLASISRWVIANEPTLRVWAPDGGAGWDKRLAWIEELRKAASRKGLTWIEDPIDQDPTHLLTWRAGTWWLDTPAGQGERLGESPQAQEVVNRLRAAPGSPAVFVAVPVPRELRAQLDIGAGKLHTAVEWTEAPGGAHYHLLGRLRGGEVEIAWVRPGVTQKDHGESPLPLRTDWEGQSDPRVAATLTDRVLRLAKLRAWLTLESPPHDGFPYRFALQPANGASRREGVLSAGEIFSVVLRAEPRLLTRSVTPRYLYVFGIDSFGNSVLLFPRSAQGAVENRYPVLSTPGDPWPAELKVGSRDLVRIREPFGIDTYFLLSTDEPIPNPWILQYAGVRTRSPRGKTPLEELLSQTGVSQRGAEPLSTSANWSLERLTFETTPARP